MAILDPSRDRGLGLALYLLVSVGPSTSMAGTIQTFQEGTALYTGCQDTELDQAAAGIPQGGSMVISIDQSDPQVTQGLIRFESLFGPGPGQVPVDAFIHSATLTVNVASTTDAGTSIAIHRMLMTWDENSTWTSMTGGVSTDGVEAVAAADSVLPDPTLFGPQVFPGLKATVQAWSDGAPNLGWVIVTDSTNGWDFESSEAGTVVNRPLLTVDWSPKLSIEKRAFQADGTAVPSGAALPTDVPVRYMLYIDNPGAAVTDVSLRDVLDSVYTYQPGTMIIDNSLSSSVVCPGGSCDEAAIFAQVVASGTPLGDGDAMTAPLDADQGSYSVASKTIDLGDSGNSNNAQLDLAADSVFAFVFTVRVR